MYSQAKSRSTLLDSRFYVTSLNVPGVIRKLFAVKVVLK